METEPNRMIDDAVDSGVVTAGMKPMATYVMMPLATLLTLLTMRSRRRDDHRVGDVVR
jgi:hypothetical protein